MTSTQTTWPYNYSNSHMLPSPSNANINGISPNYPMLGIIPDYGIPSNSNTFQNYPKFTPNFNQNIYGMYGNFNSAQNSPIFPVSGIDYKNDGNGNGFDCINSSSDETSGSIKPSKCGSRRYKTPSPQILRHRRQAANARERRRMNNLNSAFEKLRTVLPEMDSGRRLSKYETLQMAQHYIYCLIELLNQTDNDDITVKKEEK
uniref:BHLH domain-containing protein n=1 Tax=Strongyloides stercoralis TaxID=6248 RepID=A0A0K0ER47_STRER